jgi:hypothetical protein
MSNKDLAGVAQKKPALATFPTFSSKLMPHMIQVVLQQYKTTTKKHATSSTLA